MRRVLRRVRSQLAATWGDGVESGIRADYSVTWPAHDFATGYLVFGIRVAGESDLTQMDGPVQGNTWIGWRSKRIDTRPVRGRGDRPLLRPETVHSGCVARKVEELQQRLVLTAELSGSAPVNTSLKIMSSVLVLMP